MVFRDHFHNPTRPTQATARKPRLFASLVSCIARRCQAVAAASFVILTSTGAMGGELELVELVDPACDWAVRRTDAGGVTPVGPNAHPPPDLIRIVAGPWNSNAPTIDLFAGSFVDEGLFVRLELHFAGLVNPPGCLDPLTFDPFRFGDNPVFGFVEIDMDDNDETGGEIKTPQHRYLGNVARFGGIPMEEDGFDERIALDASAFDGDFTTSPYVERHGEEFHLALLQSSCQYDELTIVNGSPDEIFEAGETWDIRSRWFHRAHGFESFSFVKGGAAAGEYAPLSIVRFEHSIVTDTTIVSLVFPTTNEGAAASSGQPVQPINQSSSDQTSIEEGLTDLALSAEFLDMFPTGLPEEEIISDWDFEEVEDALEPEQWRITAIVGTSFTQPAGTGEFFVWSDIFPNVVRGDVNGENDNNNDDREQIQSFIESFDADDGLLDGVVPIDDFGDDFSVFDVSNDGQVDEIDVSLVNNRGDYDGDSDVDLTDFGRLQICFGSLIDVCSDATCAHADLDGDCDVDLYDVKMFYLVRTGP
jgi:hypothetical protein